MKTLFSAALGLAGLSMVLFSPPVGAANQTRTEVIKTDQCLRVIGWTQNCVTFKANTVVEKAMQTDFVVSGTVGKDACLKAQGWSPDASCAVFKAGSPIYFQDEGVYRGRVITGTLAQDSGLRPVGQPTARQYKAGHTVTFDQTGHVIKETN